MKTPDKRRALQEQLAAARAALEAAQGIADELEESFEFLGQTYYPKKSITKEYGGWAHEGGTDVPGGRDWYSSNNC